MDKEETVGVGNDSDEVVAKLHGSKLVKTSYDV